MSVGFKPVDAQAVQVHRQEVAQSCMQRQSVGRPIEPPA